MLHQPGKDKSTQNSESRPQRFTPSPNVKDLVDVCTTLGIKFTKSEMVGWFDGLPEHEPLLPEHVPSKTTDSFLTGVIRYVVIDHRSDNSRDKLINYLYDKIGAAQASPCLPIFPEHKGGFAARQTKMNTSHERFSALDFHVEKYLAQHPNKSPLQLVDVGVGYPPMTTCHTAKKFEGRANVIGVDSSTPDFVIRFSWNDQHYLAFYEMNVDDGEFKPIFLLEEAGISWSILQYHQLDGLYREFLLRQAEEIKRTFIAAYGPEIHRQIVSLRNDLGESLQDSVRDNLLSRLAYSDSHGNELLLQPMRKFSVTQPNLVFRKDDFCLRTVDAADLIRLGNVLIPSYYSALETTKAIKLLGAKLTQGGNIIVVTDDMLSFTLERLDNNLIPRSCAVKLQYNHIVQTPMQVFPRLASALRTISSTARHSKNFSELGSDYTMNQIDAAVVQKNLLNLGMESSLHFKNSETWIDIELPRIRPFKIK